MSTITAIAGSALSHGVHPPSDRRCGLRDPAHVYVFGEDGALVAGAPYAQA
jgi:hypothetical protein